MEIPSSLLLRAAVPYGPISLSARLVGKLDILRLDHGPSGMSLRATSTELDHLFERPVK